MIVRALAFGIVLLGALAAPAAGWDPFGDERWRDEPVPPPAEPMSYEPPGEPPALDPPASAVPDGIYYVTDTYAADVVATIGPLTTYRTVTVHESTGTYARVLETVGTGSASALDGSAFNGRAALTDGRPVAGTFYENFVLTASGLLSVNVVFFQDDSELARSVMPPPLPTPAPTRAPTPIPPSPSPATPTAWGPTPPPLAVMVPIVFAPLPTATPAPSHRVPVIRTGVSPLPLGDPMNDLEVLRGRRVALWMRATADGLPAAVREWRLLSGEIAAVGPIAGTGDQPLVARWDRLAPPGTSWAMHFVFTIDGGAAGPLRAEADVSIMVRSPALVE